MKKLIKYLLPTRLKMILKSFFYSFLDIIDSITGKKSKKYPPRKLNFVGSSDFENVGNEFLEHFKKIGNLKKADHVLDIGCGVGRMAIPLTDYLESDGHYLGFDIVKKGIDWCEENITRIHPNFKFVHADIKNKFYNPNGKIKSEKYIFPAANHQFDFCLATSVFTHMLPSEVERYIKETSRITKKGGLIFFTFFLIPNNVKDFYKTHCIDFAHKFDENTFYSHKDCIEAETGYRESYIKNLLTENYFQDIKIYKGKWCDQTNGYSYQDILVAIKS